MTALQVAAGAVAGGALALWAGPSRRRRGRTIYAVGLAVAALLYVVFAAAGRAAPREVALELAGLLAFGGIAAGGLRFVPALLGLGWLLHAGWDVALHGFGPRAYAPPWYPGACLGFDVVVGLVALVTLRGQSAGRAGRPGPPP